MELRKRLSVKIEEDFSQSSDSDEACSSPMERRSPRVKPCQRQRKRANSLSDSEEDEIVPQKKQKNSKGKKSAKEIERERKLQARKIRNRQSAALSRQRKADRVQHLETQVTDLMKENAYLRHIISNLAPTLLQQESLADQGTNLSKSAAFALFKGRFVLLSQQRRQPWIQ